jgi:hypothetical protein
MARPAVKATIVDEKALVLNYAAYADGSATSDVAMQFGGGSGDDMRATSDARVTADTLTFRACPLTANAVLFR